MPLRIANAAGFLGDWLAAPRRLVEAAARETRPVDYLTLEYLAELTLSILARQREKNPQLGYAGDFLDVLAGLLPALRAQGQLKIVTNAGGMNPAACVRRAAEMLAEAGLSDVVIACVSGDDLLPRLDQLRAAGCEFANLDTGAPLASLAAPVVSANAYLGARPIAEALAGGARIVVTGRVADASLTVGPAVHEFGWNWDDCDRLAAASVAGHLIECGAQATGGYSVDWKGHNLADVGYPIAELEPDGRCVITKPPGSGGRVDRQTVVEQLVYEIGDPRHYLTPDVEVDFTSVEVAEVGPDRVAVSGASGRAAPDDYKVSLAYRDGYLASGQLLVYGDDRLAKARACGEMILARVAQDGHTLARTNIELLGSGDGVPTGKARIESDASSPSPREVMLRVTVHDADRAAVENFARQIAPLITSGPAGLAGYAAGRPQVRPVFAYWPTTVAKSLVQAEVEIRAAREWLA